MPEASIRVEGLDKLQQVFAKLTGPQLNQAMQQATRKIGEQIRSGMMKYPGPSHSPVKWASRKQQVWYFAARREAGLDPEYVRQSDPWSQRLMQSWVVVPHGDAGAVVGTRVTYAPWVQSKEYQQPMHEATGWRTDEDVVKEVERSGVIKRLVEAEITSLLRSL